MSDQCLPTEGQNFSSPYHDQEKLICAEPLPTPQTCEDPNLVVDAEVIEEVRAPKKSRRRRHHKSYVQSGPTLESPTYSVKNTIPRVLQDGVVAEAHHQIFGGANNHRANVLSFSGVNDTQKSWLLPNASLSLVDGVESFTLDIEKAFSDVGKKKVSSAKKKGRKGRKGKKGKAKKAVQKQTAAAKKGAEKTDLEKGVSTSYNDDYEFVAMPNANDGGLEGVSVGDELPIDVEEVVVEDHNEEAQSAENVVPDKKQNLKPIEVALEKEVSVNTSPVDEEEKAATENQAEESKKQATTQVTTDVVENTDVQEPASEPKYAVAEAGLSQSDGVAGGIAHVQVDSQDQKESQGVTTNANGPLTSRDSQSKEGVQSVAPSDVAAVAGQSESKGSKQGSDKSEASGVFLSDESDRSDKSDEKKRRKSQDYHNRVAPRGVTDGQKAKEYQDAKTAEAEVQKGKRDLRENVAYVAPSVVARGEAGKSGDQRHVASTLDEPLHAVLDKGGNGAGSDGRHEGSSQEQKANVELANQQVANDSNVEVDLPGEVILPGSNPSSDVFA